MKKFLVIFLMICISLSAFAIQERDININAGAGYAGSRGFLGVSLERFFTPNHALSAAIGADLIGMSSHIGYKYFTGNTRTTNSIWDKCFFIFDCDSHFYMGGGLQYAGKTTMTVLENGVDIRKYETDSKWLGMANIGIRDVYKSNITVDWELSYRSIFAGGESIQTLGAPGNDQDFLELGYKTIGVSIALGYLF